MNSQPHSPDWAIADLATSNMLVMLLMLVVLISLVESAAA
jgi:hypothetical protein